MTLPPALIDASDLSVVIPFRADAPERAENMDAVLRHLSQMLAGVEIIVIEDGPELRGAPSGVRYEGRVNAHAFHRTQLLNHGIEALSQRPFAAAWDTDVMIFPEAFAQALRLLRGGAGLVYPFDGRFLDLRGAGRRRVLASADLTDLPPLPGPRGGRFARGDLVCVNRDSVGGAVLFERAAFRRTGGYHEGFRAWGFEDAEICARMAKLGVAAQRVQGWPLVHLSHPRKRRGSGWYAATRRNAALHAHMAGLERAEIEALIFQGALRNDMEVPALGWRRLWQAG